MKTTSKVQKLTKKLAEAESSIDTIEKDVRFALRTYYKDRIEGKKQFKLKTIYKYKKLILRIFLTVNGKSVLQGVLVYYSPTIVEDAIEKINMQLANR